MPHTQPVWDNEEKTVILIELKGEWTWEDFKASSQRLLEMLDERQTVIDIITRVHENSHVPASMVTHFPSIVRMNLLRNPYLGSFVVVGASPLTVTMLGMFNRVYGQRISKTYTAQSVEEARATIDALRRARTAST
jgi:hypothetical protein